MEKLIRLAGNIEDEKLRKKVVEFLKNPTLSHEEFKKYPKCEIDKIRTPFTIPGHGTVERGDLINHIASVTEVCLQVAEILEKNYGVKVNKDYLVAGALLHDIMKIFEWKVEGEEVKHSGILLDHSMLAVAELYHRGFPEEVIHIVASHFGETGPTPPRNFEALILHYVDNFMSTVEFHLSTPKQQPLQLLLLDEDVIKKLVGEKTEEKT
ncbi:MAG: HDIG domain-containing protein [Candidatus Aenigmatarchaeota archaeon]